MHVNLIKRGAEASVYGTEWFGRPAVSKVRTPKPYRHPALDARLRHRRTLREAKMLCSVKSLGIRAPLVYLVDPLRHIIVMERVPGVPIHSMPDRTILKHCHSMGRIAGLLHSAGMIHGDLTTSNFLLAGEPWLIDMGLSRRASKPEDWATDMRLVKEILNSAHAAICDVAWDLILEGYAETMPEWERVRRLVSIIESRGRYARVT